MRSRWFRSSLKYGGMYPASAYVSSPSGGMSVAIMLSCSSSFPAVSSACPATDKAMPRMVLAAVYRSGLLAPHIAPLATTCSFRSTCPPAGFHTMLCSFGGVQSPSHHHGCSPWDVVVSRGSFQ